MKEQTALVSALLATLWLVVGCSGPIPPATGQTPADTLSWTLATQYEDNTPLPVSAIRETLIMWGSASGGPYDTGSSRVTAPGTSVVLSRPAPGTGTRCYVAFTVTTTGVNSRASNEVCKTVLAPPKEPTDLRVE